MSEIQFPSNWWTAGAVKAWEKGSCRSRLLPSGLLEQSLDGGHWHVSQFVTVEHLELNKPAEVPVLPIPGWAAGYDRAAEQRGTGGRSRERGGAYEVFGGGHFRSITTRSVERDCIDNGYTPVPTVLGGWRELKPEKPAPEQGVIGTGKHLADFTAKPDAPPAPRRPATHVWDSGQQAFVPLNPQPDPDRLSRGEFLTMLAAYCVADPSSELDDRIEQLCDDEPAIVAALKGRA